MKEERYSIIFSSKTGNTAELANAIRDALPQENCDYFGTSEIEEPVSEMLYIGFWTDQGNADKSALELLQRIKNKKVFLFGTAGFGENEAYFQKVLNNVKSSMDKSNPLPPVVKLDDWRSAIILEQLVPGEYYWYLHFDF